MMERMLSTLSAIMAQGELLCRLYYNCFFDSRASTWGPI